MSRGTIRWWGLVPTLFCRLLGLPIFVLDPPGKALGFILTVLVRGIQTEMRVRGGGKSRVGRIPRNATPGFVTRAADGCDTRLGVGVLTDVFSWRV